MSHTSKSSGAKLIAGILQQSGVRRAYGVPGQRILPLFHELQNNYGIKINLARHEQGAAFMADLDARISGFAVVLTTSGPGAINALTGAASAYTDSVPILIVSAQAARDEFGKQAIQEGTGIGRNPDIQTMYEATVKASMRPASIDQIVPAVLELLEVAKAGRPGPVHLDLPSDLLTEESVVNVKMDDLSVPGQDSKSGMRDSTPIDSLSHQISDVYVALKNAKRPLLAIGNGVRDDITLTRVYQCSELLNVPIVNSFISKRVVDQLHGSVIGTIGSFGMISANRAFFEKADLILCLGMSFNELTTAGWTEPCADRIIRVDIDERAHEYAADRTTTIINDVNSFLESLSRFAEEHPPRTFNGWDSDDLSFNDNEIRPSLENTFHPVEVFNVLSEFASRSVTFISDIGQNAYWSERYLRTRGDNRFHINGALGTMGHAVAGAFGAAEALRTISGDERVICICGDGGFMMGALEISTAVQNMSPVLWVVLNNGTLGTQQEWFERNSLPSVASQMPSLDFVKLAQAMGAEASTVSSRDCLREEIQAFVQTGIPTVLEARIDGSFAPLAYPEDYLC